MSVIFIISQHRTGSTLLQNILDANSDVTMAFDEMNLYEPFRKNTLDRLLATHIASIDDLLLAIEKGDVYGAFWRRFEEGGLSLDRLRSRLQWSATLDEKTILSAVLELLRADSGVSSAGIKYPVHFSKLPLLKGWFPESRVIMLFRNPKAMIASKLNDGATRARKRKTLIHRFLIHYSTLLFFSLEFSASVRVYLKHRRCTHKVEYESLVLDEESTIRRVCEYCDIKFQPEMLSVTGKESSFGYSWPGKPNSDSLNQFQRTLNRFDSWLIGLLTNRSYRKLQ